MCSLGFGMLGALLQELGWEAAAYTRGPVQIVSHHGLWHGAE